MYMKTIEFGFVHVMPVPLLTYLLRNLRPYLKNFIENDVKRCLNCFGILIVNFILPINKNVQLYFYKQDKKKV